MEQQFILVTLAKQRYGFVFRKTDYQIGTQSTMSICRPPPNLRLDLPDRWSNELRRYKLGFNVL